MSTTSDSISRDLEFAHLGYSQAVQNLRDFRDKLSGDYDVIGAGAGIALGLLSAIELLEEIKYTALIAVMRHRDVEVKTSTDVDA